MPYPLHLGHLGEKAVPAHVEAPSISLDGAGETADHEVGLEDGAGGAPLGELVGGGQARRPSTYDDDCAGLPARLRALWSAGPGCSRLVRRGHQGIIARDPSGLKPRPLVPLPSCHPQGT